MAVSVNRVYQKVLAIANKEQRGYITPLEFNLFADKVQKEIYNNYFHQIKMTGMKKKEQSMHADELEIIEKKLKPFQFHAKVPVDITNNRTALATGLPSDCSFIDLSGFPFHSISSVTRGNNTVVAPLTVNELIHTENNNLTRATLTRSVFVRQNPTQQNSVVIQNIRQQDTEVTSKYLLVFPPVATTTYNISTDDAADPLGVSIPDGDGPDAEQFNINMYLTPNTPNWTYVVVNGKALYNPQAVGQADFQLHISEEENIVNRILMLAGITMKQQDIYQAGAADIQLTKQQQNS